ncbi:clostripain-related cysteine peptidase [Hyalangium versicolor]|uniref:clostripain-related cysteine peptidase n=1 Tax=Hyalangium versicolor TaxID=2861190 RepID=UPI001CCE33DC|nr:clostripain-related cysteine peptidase [Hyalangium versicolor]
MLIHRWMRCGWLWTLALLSLHPLSAHADGNQSGEAEWTVLVYMNADNDLDASALADINEMEAANLGNLNVIVQVDREGQGEKGQLLSSAWAGTKRLKIKQDNNLSQIGSTELDDLGEMDMGDYVNLAEFASWGIMNFPAKKYALIVWSHGNGFKAEPNSLPLKVSIDGTSHTHIDLRNLEDALVMIQEDTQKRIELLGFDACLMQMTEVGYQLKNHYTLLVGSEDLESNDGWAYDQLLTRLSALPPADQTPLAFADIIVQTTLDYYRRKGVAATLSVAEAKAVMTLSQKVQAFVKAVNFRRKQQLDALQKSYSEAQRFRNAGADYVDLFDYFKTLRDKLTPKNDKDKEMKAAIDAILELQPQVILRKDNVGQSVNRAQGLTLYLPRSWQYQEKYSDLAFAKATAWGEFIQKFNASMFTYELQLLAGTLFIPGFELDPDETEDPTRDIVVIGDSRRQGQSELISNMSDEILTALQRGLPEKLAALNSASQSTEGLNKLRKVVALKLKAPLRNNEIREEDKKLVEEFLGKVKGLGLIAAGP